MNKRLKTWLLQYGITTAIGLLISYFVMSSQGLFVLFGSNAETFSILCDAFFVPGAVLLSVGALVWVAGTGFFDSMAYIFRVAAHMFIPFVKSRPKSYYDYKTEKAERGGKTPMFILYTGVGFVALALVFLACYSAM